MSPEQPLKHAIQVRWSDMDALGHVNNARYFTYLEEARLAWFESLPEPWYDDSSGPVVARAACDFRRPITGTGEIVVTTRLGPPGNSSITLYSDIAARHDGELYARAEVVLVWVDRRTGRSRSLPDAIRRQAAKD